MKSVVVLGAGLVTRPLVQYLLKHGYEVCVASRTVSKAEQLIGGHPHGRAATWTVDREDELDRMVQAADLVVSLLPAAYHPAVARRCIAHRTPMATTSYVSPQMQELDEPAREAGVVILNESGVDPGIDHMSAMRIIHAVQGEGGEISSFMSYCGGLPAPDANTNPFGYKFSWSPKGVLLAGKNDGRYRKDAEEVYVPGTELFGHHWPLHVPGIGELEAYPNRNSLPYERLYGIEGVPTMFRGTLRYPGWCSTLKAFADLGYLDETESDWTGKTFADFTAGCLGVSSTGDLRAAVADRLGIARDSDVLERFEWLGLFSQEALPLSRGAAIDIMTARMLDRMPYAAGERDMIILRHEFVAQRGDGRREAITSTLIDYGIPGGDSSMSRTVSLPAAIGCRMILEGTFAQPGVWVPVIPELYDPMLAELETLGIRCEEEARPL